MKILLVEENRYMADTIVALLKSKNYSVDSVFDSYSAQVYAALGIYDLLIIDAPLSNMDGCSVIREMRSQHIVTPILLISDRLETDDRIRILNAGADSCLAKPFDTKELLACIRALLRRRVNEENVLHYGNTMLDISTCMLKCGDKQVRLSAREFEVMRMLLLEKDKVIRKDIILARVWGMESKAVENHVEVYIGFLRKKLTIIGSDIRIVALRRLGYCLEVRDHA